MSLLNHFRRKNPYIVQAARSYESSDFEDDDFGVFEDFQKDLQNELDEISDMYINAEPRKMHNEDDGKAFERIAAEMENVDEHGFLKKQIITEGVGELPPPFARVLVHYDFFKEGSEEPFDSTFIRAKPCRLRLDEGEMILGLEMAIKTMKKKESAKFLIHWNLAFGPYGCPPRVPKECTILAYVSIVDITPLVSCGEGVEVSGGEVKLSDFARIYKDAKNCQCEGNDEFTSSNYKNAIKCYRKCIGMLNDAKLSCEEDEQKMIALKVKCLVNLAVCFNKIKKPEQACAVSRQALNLQKNNVKAMYQYGKSNLILSNLELAEKWLKKAHSLKPDDSDILRELAKLREKKEKDKVDTTLFCQRAMSDYKPAKGEKK